MITTICVNCICQGKRAIFLQFSHENYKFQFVEILSDQEIQFFFKKFEFSEKTFS